jgi:hypothetical protein
MIYFEKHRYHAMNLSSEEWYRFDADFTSIGDTLFFLIINLHIALPVAGINVRADWWRSLRHIIRRSKFSFPRYQSFRYGT